jgi:hypothetical protein
MKGRTMKYTITVTATVVQTIEVDAENQDQAIDMALEQFDLESATVTGSDTEIN